MPPSSQGIRSPAIPGRFILEAARCAVANLIDSNPEEIVFTANTTQGIELALAAVRFKAAQSPGDPDVILVGEHEHDTVRYCVSQVSSRYDVRERVVEVGTQPVDSAIDVIVRSLDPHVKAIILSHVLYDSGQVRDIAGIIRGVTAALEAEEQTPPVFIIDGAQAVGHIDVDVHSLGCDYYAADGHKWLMGPVGSGFLYVRKELLDAGESLPVYQNYMIAKPYRPLKPSGDIYEPATLNIKPFVGLKAAISRLMEEGKKGAKKLFDLAAKRSREFSELLLSEFAGFDVQVSNGGSGIVLLRFGGVDEPSVYDEVRRAIERSYHVVCRSLPEPPSLRFCVHVTTSSAELQIAAAALKRVLETEFPELADTLVRRKVEAGQVHRKAADFEERRGEVLATVAEQYEHFSRVLLTRYEKALSRLDKKQMDSSHKAYQRMREKLSNASESLRSGAEHATSEEELRGVTSRVLGEYREAIEED